MCDLSVRPLVAADVPMLLDMLRELAADTGQSAAITAQRADLDEALAEVPPRFRGLIAEDGSGVVGYLSYTIDYSIWAGGDFIRVDDVYVRERARSQGVGRQLMRAMADKGVAQDMGVRWQMEPGNHGAGRFYAAIGAVPRDKTIWNWSVAAMGTFLDRVDPTPIEGGVPSEAGRGLPGEDGFILVLRRDDGQR